MFDGFDSELNSLGAGIDDVAVLFELQRRLDLHMIDALGELDAVGMTDVVEGLSTKAWVSKTARCSGVTAARRVSVARAVRRRYRPDVLDRLRSGVVGFDHLVVIGRWSNPRIEPTWSDNAGPMLDLAKHLTFAKWERVIAALARLVDTDGTEPAPPAEESWLDLRDIHGPDGVIGVEVVGEFFGDYAEVVRQAINDATARHRKQVRNDAEQFGGSPTTSESQLRAKALMDLCRFGTQFTLSGNYRPRTAEVSVILQADEHGQPRAYSPTGDPLTADVIERMMCDPELRAVLLDSLGQPLDVGHSVRLATDAQRAALAARDGGCCFPGCDAPAHHTEAHHVRHHRNGGSTAVNNLACLCRHHHGLVHRVGWAMHITTDGWTLYTHPCGITIWGQQHGVQRQGPIPEELNTQPEPPIRPKVKVRGGTIDLADAIATIRRRYDRMTATPNTRIHRPHDARRSNTGRNSGRTGRTGGATRAGRPTVGQLSLTPTKPPQPPIRQ
ncbi:MAG: HNH endonuclease [Microthrixaceae bacterium]|nr:HNH endonuclease [Microthrixaceae bacterium]